MRWPPRILGAPLTRRDLMIGVVLLVVVAVCAMFVRFPKPVDQQEHENAMSRVRACACEYRHNHGELARTHLEAELRAMFPCCQILRYEVRSEGVQVVVACGITSEPHWLPFE